MLPVEADAAIALLCTGQVRSLLNCQLYVFGQYQSVGNIKWVPRDV